VTDKCYGEVTASCIRHSHLNVLISRMIGTALLLIAAVGVCVAADQTSAPIACKLGQADTAGLNGDLSTDIQALSDFMETLRSMLKRQQFEQIDCVADHFRSAKERFPGGVWKLHSLYQGLAKPVQYPVHATAQDWAASIELLRQWVREQPKSVTARIALASAYEEFAWDARGKGYADTVSDSGWNLFEARTTESKRLLDEASILPTKCPEWYLVMLQLAVDQTWKTAQVRALFEEASKAEPGYYYYARVFARYLQPKWNGEPGDTEAFIQEIADRVGGEQGDFLYFEIANNLICGCENDLRLSWPRIVKGFEASEKLYGSSMLNLNLIAYVACHYGQRDPVLAEKVFSRIGEQWYPETWGRQKDFESSKQWAASYAPTISKQQAIEALAAANEKIPEGSRYKAAFEEKYNELFKDCVRTHGELAAKFETLTSVGADGTVGDMKVYFYGPTAMCLYERLHSFQEKNEPAFPRPPQGPYWIRLDVDGTQFTSAISKPPM
jgi:Domain of unknown function (DUF4034)